MNIICARFRPFLGNTDHYIMHVSFIWFWSQAISDVLLNLFRHINLVKNLFESLRNILVDWAHHASKTSGTLLCNFMQYTVCSKEASAKQKVSLNSGKYLNESYWCLWKKRVVKQQEQLSTVVLKHFSKLKLKWCFAGALLEHTVNCMKVLYQRRLLIPKPNYFLTYLKWWEDSIES